MKGIIFAAGVALLQSLAATAQRNCGLWFNEVPLVADTAANRLYVTIEPNVGTALRGTLRWDESRVVGVRFGDTALENGKQDNLELSDWTANAAPMLTVGDREWTLVFSTLPFVVIDCPLEEMSANYTIVKGDPQHTRKYPGRMSVVDARCRTKLKNSTLEGMARFDSDIRIRLRGATSAGAAKKSFNIELVKDGESQDAHLLGYRKDDDWILSAEYTDYSRMRNRVLMDLWNAVDDLPYAKDNRYQGNGTQGEFVEVFLNGGYYGLFCFTDKIDRKKLNLKKTREATELTPEVKRGLLWKANWESAETYLSGYSERPANDSFLWPYIESKQTYGWEQKYPDDTVSQAYFDPICHLIDFLATGQAEFTANYLDKLYEQNVIDYILFVQVFQLLDNQKKNYYLSVRNVDKQEKFLLTLWDLDGSLGRYAGGDETGDDPKQVAWGEKLSYHNLIHRFKSKNLRPDGFATRMNNRWQYLSTHQLSLANIRALMERYARQFAVSGAWERERDRWLSTYKNSKKIAATPQQEVEYMMDFLTANYDVFNQVMASAQWEHDAYNEEDYVRMMAPAALYVVGPDVTSTHEENTVTLPGSVDRELVGDIDHIDFRDGRMTVVREDGERPYAIDAIKEVRTQNTGLYATPAFVPDTLQRFFQFDTRYAPADEHVAEAASTFAVRRTLQVTFDGSEALVSGNLAGIVVMVDSAAVSFQTELEGVEILVSGRSEHGHISIDSKHPVKVAAAEGGALLAGITATGDLVVNTPYALNFYNDEFDGKCIQTSGDVTVEGGHLYFLLTGSGTLTDADFLQNPTLGARAVMADNITVNGGRLSVKSLGHNGAVGLAAVKKVVINDGHLYLATYDDPVKAGQSVTVNGGFTFASSLTNDGVDSKGDIFVNGGVLSACSPEGAEAAFDVNHFYCDGGTVVGVGYKSERPMADKSKQAALRLYKSSGVGHYVRIADAEGCEVATIETPAYPTTTVVYASPELQKGATYTLLTGDTLDALHTLTTLTAE
ncbi:MAG: CotH kinase family protein [Bacteroidaceae bacterium]|nr:CotH kinase family protein [Bacteroidaceae bacterium]